MIETRNSEVTSKLLQNYPHVKHVFCISNHIYWDRREKAAEDALPWLNLSNIIALRKHCIGLVADHQMQDASVFMKEKVPALVSSADLWVRSGLGSIAAETREQVRKASEQVERVLQSVSGC